MEENKIIKAEEVETLFANGKFYKLPNFFRRIKKVEDVKKVKNIGITYKMKDFFLHLVNSITLGFLIKDDFELFVLKDLLHIIEVIGDRHPHDVAFKFCCQEILKMNEKELDNIESKYRYNFEEETREHFLRIDSMTNQVNRFCDTNGFTKLLKKKLIFFMNVDPAMTHEILCEFSDILLRRSDAVSVLNRQKTIYYKLTDIIPCEEEFINYLKCRHEAHLDAESMKEYLSEYMDNEVEKFYNLPKNRKYIKQEIIDITPQQTLSIETTTDNAEGKKSHIKPYSSKVILEVIEKINEKEVILPKNLSGKAKFMEYAKVIKSILGDEFDFKAGTLQNQYNEPLNSEEQGQVFDILKQYGYDDLANQYRLKDRIRD